MNRVRVIQQDNTQVAPIGLGDPAPAPDSAIRLPCFPLRLPDDSIDPFKPDRCPVGSPSHEPEVLGRLHRQGPCARVLPTQTLGNPTR